MEARFGAVRVHHLDAGWIPITKKNSSLLTLSSTAWNTKHGIFRPVVRPQMCKKQTFRTGKDLWRALNQKINLEPNPYNFFELS